jgi:predicted ATPase/class 3 adenylate cyclase
MTIPSSPEDFPSGILTFFFSDLVDSTTLWEKYPEAMGAALSRHDHLLKDAILQHKGRIIKSTGDGIHAVFISPKEAVLAAVSIQRSMQSESWENIAPLLVRIGLHTGNAQYREGDYYGNTVNRAARLMSIGHGGQVLLSKATRELVKDDLPKGIELQNLGSQSLKGLSLPEEVYQILIPGLLMEFPPLKSGISRLDNLPSQITPFVGREPEIDSLSKLLLDPDVSLVSVIAPGGMGKTRLAIELGSRLLKDFKNGVFFVELAPIKDSENIVLAVAEAIGYQFQQNGRSQRRQVLDYLENRQLLLIMDNFEHLINGAEIVAEMLRSAPRLRILVTSRQRLYQSGETLFPLHGLDLPDLNTEEEAPRYAAIQLFQQAARRARPDFELTPENLPEVIRICQQVQGMPLGILLAAPWVSVLSTREIAEEIKRGLDILEAEESDLPERLRSIRAVFDYSWSMMSQTEQEIFAKLAVFRGGFNREAGMEVVNAGLRNLGSLHSKALIVRDADQGRYSIHELLRQYAEEKLRQSGQYSQTRHEHTLFYLSFLAKQTADLKGSRQLPTLKLIEIDFKNIRESWDDAVDNRAFELIGKALEAMYLFCSLQSRLEDGKALFDRARLGLAPELNHNPHPVWLALGIRFYHAEDSQSILKERLERSLASARQRDDPMEEAFCLHTLGTIAHYVAQNPPQAIDFYKECVDIYHQVGEKYYLAQTLIKLGEAYQLIGQTQLTFEYVNEAYQLQREIGDQMGESETLRALGMTAFQAGYYDDYDGYIDRAFDIQIETNYLVGQASSNLYRGVTRFWEGKLVEGRALVQQGLDQALDVVDYSTQAWCYAILSMMDSAVGNYLEAKGELQKAQAIEIDPFRQTGAGNPFLQLHINYAQALLTSAKGDYENANRHMQQPLRLAFQTSSQPYMTLFTAWAVLFYAQDNQLESAAELLGLALEQPIKITGWLDHWVLLDQVRAELQAKLGKVAYLEALARGKSLELKVTLEKVLHESDAINKHS